LHLDRSRLFFFAVCRTLEEAMTAAPIATDVALLRRSIERHREAQLERVAAGEDGLALGRANARFLEGCLRSCFEVARGAARVPSSIALAGVGGLGRGAVALRSDADVVVVVGRGALGAKEAEAFTEALLYPLWDATLAVGHQILAAGDALRLAQQDLATATALLDMRPLAGDESLVQTLIADAAEGLFSERELGTLIERLEAEAAARHQRFGGSVYLLEPDVKSGQGGLRDLDGARWVARARYRVGRGDAEARLGVWGELVRLGVLVGREAHEIAAAEELLWRVRNRLHARAGRKSDRLGFEEQEALAVAMGYGDDRARAAERLMHEYYVYARIVTRARESLFDRLRPVRRRAKGPAANLGDGVHLFDGAINIAGAAELQTDPALALRAYAACVRQDAPLLSFARDAIVRAAADPAWCERLRAQPGAAELFLELVCTVADTRTRRGSMAAELHDVGLLLAMVPEFLPVTGRVHHDVYHVYTVDVHSVAAVDRLRQLARGELAGEYPLASRLAAEIARPRPLFLAVLLHDVGKGWPDRKGSRQGHSKTGAELCRRILPRLGMSPEETEEAAQLVVDHLVMYHVATRRDLDDPATIEEFCRGRGREGLCNLYLLTVADLSTTSPTAMTSWKARMLDELYFAAEQHLAGRQPRADAERVARARAAVLEASGPGGDVGGFLASMPERYLLANRPESIVHHARVVGERGARAAHVALVPYRHPDAAELCVVASDRPGLLASIAAAMTANRLEVLAAQVYSRSTGDEERGRGSGAVEAVDLFWVRDEGGLEGVERALGRLARDLDDVCAGRVDPAALLASRVGSRSPWRERPSPAVPTEVLVDDRASPRHTVVEVFARDRPGLLYVLARGLHELGLSIVLSKITTEGTRVADVFYVNELDGKKVTPGPRYREIHHALLGAIGDAAGFSDAGTTGTSAGGH
jgi:[protein-PII] uridylyltransferase